MKRKIYFLILIVSVVICCNVYFSHKNSVMSDFLLVNVEALAGDFEWDGTDWTDDEQWYNDTWGTSKWRPVLTECTVTTGVNIGIIESTETFSGHKVMCGTGSGNCVSGSLCNVG